MQSALTRIIAAGMRGCKDFFEDLVDIERLDLQGVYAITAVTLGH